MQRRWMVLGIAGATFVSFLSACSDEGPTHPGPTAPQTSNSEPTPVSTTISIVSGETGEPVVGARVVVAGQELMTDGSGLVTLEARPSDDVTVDILAESFFDRVTYFGSPGGTTFSLWPSRSPNGLDEETTRRLVYTSTSEDAVPGVLSLRRPANDKALVIMPEVSVLESARAMRVVENAVGALQKALGGELDVLVDRGGMGMSGTVVEVLIDADVTSSDYVGRWQRFTDRDNTITSARLTFRSLTRLIDNEALMVHNLGHAVGLNHSLDANDRMLAAWWTRRQPDFSAKEGVVLRLMFQRRPGNRFPDTDRDAGTGAVALTARDVASGTH